MPPMWQEAQRRERERWWPAVERYLAGLPPRLFEQAKLLEYDLAIAYSSTGRFADVFLGAERFPALSIGGWLLADLAPERAVDGIRDTGRAEERLFVTSLLLAARTHIVAGVLDRASPYDAERFALAQLFSEQALAELAALVPASSPFWQRREAAALDGLEETLAASRRRLAPGPDDGPEVFLVPRWSTHARIVASAALELVGAGELEGRVGSMLRATAEAFEIVATLGSLHADALEGRTTYPIVAVTRAAGLPVRPGADPTATLGALVATGALGTIVGAALERIRRAEALSMDLGLPTFTGYLADAGAALDARRPAVALGAHPPARDRARRRPAPLVAISRPATAAALAMAEGYLLDDPTFRESWESHREGMFGAPLVESRFPAGLVLEILVRRGLDVSAGVDAFLESTARSGFRYYDHPSSDVDTDTIGVFLRLAAAGGRTVDAAVEAVLERLEHAVAEQGRVPVWLPRVLSDGGEGGPLDLGEGCGTVAAHLLLGLLAYAPARYALTIDRGSKALLDRVADVGVAANVNYPRGFALAVLGRLTTALEGSGIPLGVGPGTPPSPERARLVLLDDLERSIGRPPATAQDAALLTIACLDLGRRDLIEPSWAARILKGQRSDGAWMGEPFAAAPTRGASVTWYSSALLTTALCYEALARWVPRTGADARGATAPAPRVI